jgi:Bacterial archaeo-eukaryotic release factor family 2
VLVANSAGIVLTEAWDAALGAGDDAHWAVLPMLGAYVREAARSVRELIVILDQHGAQVRQEVLAEQHEPRELEAEVVEGGAGQRVHKPRGGALSHNQIQRHADETVSRNAKDIAEHIRTAASTFHPRVAPRSQCVHSIVETVPSISRRSSGVGSTAAAARFSSRRASPVFPAGYAAILIDMASHR